MLTLITLHYIESELESVMCVWIQQPDSILNSAVSLLFKIDLRKVYRLFYQSVRSVLNVQATIFIENPF